jgi:hypothetical protein
LSTTVCFQSLKLSGRRIFSLSLPRCSRHEGESFLPSASRTRRILGPVSPSVLRDCYQTATRLVQPAVGISPAVTDRTRFHVLLVRRRCNVENLISCEFSRVEPNRICKSGKPRRTASVAPGWARFGSKTQRAIRFEVASTKPLVPQPTGWHGTVLKALPGVPTGALNRGAPL